MARSSLRVLSSVDSFGSHLNLLLLLIVVVPVFRLKSNFHRLCLDSACFRPFFFSRLKLTAEAIEKISAPTEVNNASKRLPLRQVGQGTAQLVPKDTAKLKIPRLLERTSSALTPRHLHQLQQARSRCVSASSQMSAKTTDSLGSNASDFLEAKIEQLTEFEKYYELIKRGILEGHEQQLLSNEELQSHMAPVVTKLAVTNSTLKVLKRQKRQLADDLEEDTASIRQKIDGEPDGLLERAYVQAIVDRVMSATVKQAAIPFNKKQFKEDVNQLYGINDQRPSNEFNWCHVLGIWRPAATIKAAHIVPKSLRAGDLRHIFGYTNDIASDPQNAICLSSVIERHLDQGNLVIVPAPGDFTVPTTWRCLVLDRSKDKDIVCDCKEIKSLEETPGRRDAFVRVKDLHNRPLTFLNDKRPRRRYLYFRFIMSYLNAKRQNMVNLSVPLETKQFWPSPGGYLHESTLKIMARSVSGCELPPPLISGQTFKESDDPSQDDGAGNLLAAAIIEPALFSTSASEEQSMRMRELLLETLHSPVHETAPEENAEDDGE
ncbi:Uncharacterized protein PECH_003048 [Penicillium ucsense]|uniref:HNH nuclease domain-containing protein n=1 Tax=Penicillium ucsense TaxID=2839758 RepID=A0A8J8WGE2_9EURO|nr:Uncharacterized protein PECM_008395 [Penicillium ucsense]KAF7730009.1 Uncharacterized protein PECH_003048 [Penicillium ucsense]